MLSSKGLNKTKKKISTNSFLVADPKSTELTDILITKIYHQCLAKHIPLIIWEKYVRMRWKFTNSRKNFINTIPTMVFHHKKGTIDHSGMVILLLHYIITGNCRVPLSYKYIDLNTISHFVIPVVFSLQCRFQRYRYCNFYSLLYGLKTLNYLIKMA